MGSMIQFDTPAGGPVSGYFATAPGARHVIVLQEWWGLNDQIRGVCDRFAAAGFTALAPDLYKGRVTTIPDEASHLMTGLDWNGAIEQDVRGAMAHLRRMGGRVAVMGFCMGGALTVLAAARLGDIAAAVAFYGLPPADAADPRRIASPVQGHFANRDDWCTPAAVDAFAGALRSAPAKHEIFRYEAAHGFFNERRPEVYDQTAAALAWDRMVTFLTTHL